MTINSLASIFAINYKHISIGSFNITYYALFIIGGAILAYKLSQYYVKKKGYNPEAVENTFYIAFPCGIIGARIWWVIAESATFFTNHAWYEVFFIWEGGLAIQGGALAGIIAGVTYLMIAHKEINILDAVDGIVPTILLGQAIGRWGNFFNQEVYGGAVDTWTWLPSFISDRLVYKLSADGNILYNGQNGNALIYLAGEGKMVLPLFLIEGLCNIAGFFIIVYGLPALFKWLKKITNEKVFLAKGDQAFSYLIFYGTVRAVLEPLRNPEFIMGSTTGEGVLTSVVSSVVYIVLGVIGIVLCHINHHYPLKNLIKKRK